MKYQALRLAVADGVARITFDRPQAANALDLTLARELEDAANRCSGDPGVRCVLLAGSGDFFCAGGDVVGFAGRGEGLPAHLSELATHLHVAISRLARMRAPVVAAVHGAAAGAGFSLACASDLVLAAESARFVMAYTGIGLSPDGSGTYFLPRLVGLRRAMELALTNRRLSAREALEWGIVTRVVPDADLAAEAGVLAAGLAAGPTAAFGRTKRLLQGSFTESLETKMELELRALVAGARTADAREGIAAFVAKRRPEFTGRDD